MIWYSLPIVRIPIVVLWACIIQSSSSRVQHAICSKQKTLPVHALFNAQMETRRLARLYTTCFGSRLLGRSLDEGSVGWLCMCCTRHISRATLRKGHYPTAYNPQYKTPLDNLQIYEELYVPKTPIQFPPSSRVLLCSYIMQEDLLDVVRERSWLPPSHQVRKCFDTLGNLGTIV